MPNNIKQIFLIGYYGYSNFGDEWLRQNSIKLLYKHFPNAKITQLNAEKKSEYIHKYSLFKIIKQLYKSDMLVFGGGSLLQSRSSLRSLLYYLGLIICAKTMGCSIYLLAQGIGPLKSWQLGLCRKVLKNTIISYRDQNSAQLLELPGICVTDLAFYQAKISPKKEAQKIGLVIQNDRRFSYRYLNWITTLSAANNLCLIVTHQRDYKFAQKIIKKTKLLPILFLKDPIQTEPLNLLISSRYHAVIWACLQRIPSLVINSDPKLESLIKQFNLASISFNCTGQDLKKAISSQQFSDQSFTDHVKQHIQYANQFESQDFFIN